MIRNHRSEYMLGGEEVEVRWGTDERTRFGLLCTRRIPIAGRSGASLGLPGPLRARL